MKKSTKEEERYEKSHLSVFVRSFRLFLCAYGVFVHAAHMLYM